MSVNVNKYMVWLLLFFVVARIDTLSSQRYNPAPSASRLRYERIDEKQGFIQNSILGIDQDHLGYLYFGTPNGLFKFDGYKFEKHANIVDNKNSLAYNFISDVDASCADECWVLNSHFINRYSLSNGEFRRYHFQEFGNLHFRKVLVDRSDESRLWILTQNNIGCIILDSLTRDIKEVKYPLVKSPVRPFRRVVDFAANSFGGVTFLIGGEIQTLRLDDRGETILSNRLSGVNLWSVATRKNGEIFASSPNTIYRIERSEQGVLSLGEKLYHHPNAKSIYVRASDRDDLVGFVWGDGVVHIDLRGDRAEYYPIFKDNTDFQSASFGDAMVDASGVLWLGTYHAGLFKINLHQKRFNSLEQSSVGSKPSFRYFANAITGDNRGNIWIGTHMRGLMQVRVVDGEVIRYENRAAKYGLAPNSSIYMLTYFKDHLWLNDGNHIFRCKISPEGDLLSKQIVDSRGHKLNQYNCTYCDEQGVLWIGDFGGEAGGIYYIDTSESEGAKVRLLSFEADNTLRGNKISAIMRDSEGKLWFSTTNAGIYRATLKGLVIESVERIHFEGSLSGIDINSSFSIYEDSKRNIYIGLFGGGVVKLNIDNISRPETFEHFSSDDGLSDDGVYSIIEDQSGALWISNDGGLSRFDTRSKEFRNYDMSDGINNLNFRKWSAWVDSSRQIYFGGTNGVTTFRADEIKDNIFAPKVVISSVSSAQERLKIDEYINYNNLDSREGKRLRLEPSHNSLDFEFAAIQHDNPEQITYYYRLVGIESEWRSAPATLRHATYSYLPSGDYRFEVKAKTRDGVWSLGAATIDLYIAPFWYQTWWARTLFLLLIVGVITLWRRVVHQRRRLQNEIAHELRERKSEERLNQAKLEFYTNISHEIKTPLTVMSGVAESALNSGKEVLERRDFHTMVRNIHRMLQLTTQLLDFRKAVMGCISFEPVRGDIVAFMYEVMESFDTYIQQQGFKFNFITAEDEIEADFDPDKINKILSNLISNAIKYSSKESREIEVYVGRGVAASAPKELLTLAESDYITLSVADRGVGISGNDMKSIFNRFFQSSNLNLTATEKGVGVGLSFVKLLVEAHGGFIYVDSKVGEGSTFYVVLPRCQACVDLSEQSSDGALTRAVESIKESLRRDTNIISSTPREGSSLSEHTEQICDYEILIVEDNNEIRDFVREFLAPKYKVWEAENGAQGLEMALEHLPDLIITDVMMPLMDGMEMTRRIKSDPKTNHIPVIMLTVNDHIQSRIDGINAGADSYISKPFNVEHLQTRIDKLLELRSALRMKYRNSTEEAEESDLAMEGTEEDREFINSLEEIIESNLSDSEFSMTDFERKMGYSRMQFYRKVKSLTGLTSVEFVRNYRLRRSVEMMRTSNRQIREILYDVGFSSPSYYSKCFKSYYGKTPKEYLQDIRK